MDGHDFDDMTRVIANAQKMSNQGKPIVILMKTVMGKGVDFMEGTHHWHVGFSLSAQVEFVEEEISYSKEDLSDPTFSKKLITTAMNNSSQTEEFASAQDSGVFSGNFEANYNVFLEDSLIGATNTPQYDEQLTGGEAWLNLNYSIKGLNLG
ncbi:unnamed protein product, partial [Cyprideis torosa]